MLVIFIFIGENNKSIGITMKQVWRYEKTLDQKVNNDKSFFVTAKTNFISRINRKRKASGFINKQFPFTYSGVLYTKA